MSIENIFEETGVIRLVHIFFTRPQNLVVRKYETYTVIGSNSVDIHSGMHEIVYSFRMYTKSPAFPEHSESQDCHKSSKIKGRGLPGPLANPPPRSLAESQNDFAIGLVHLDVPAVTLLGAEQACIAATDDHMSVGQGLGGV